ncbi:MAG: DNA cytosine methyltransferase [Dehalococcoidia bacterium]|nr:DNA cytosine methyltransferase [Dehalococcoidia bacterium]
MVGLQARPTAIDLFAGAGGLSTGFQQAGFDVVAANDSDPYAAATYRLNHPSTLFVGGSIESITEAEFLGGTGLHRGELDVLVGGPPCQAFSVYNHRRGMHDERSGLFREYLRMVHGLLPRMVVIENVTGITSIDGGRAVHDIKDSLRNLGYHVESAVLKAEEYGVPQERRRIFFVGSRSYLPIRWPTPTYAACENIFTIGHNLKPLVTVDEAIGDLPTLNNSEGAEKMDYTAAPVSDYQRQSRSGSAWVFNHVAPQLAPINLERMKHIPPGGSWRDIPYQLLPAGMKLANRSDHTKRYGRLHPDGQACTIMTRCDVHWGAYIHPYQDRAITVREAARFQSFPDKFQFLGSRGEQYKQVGNAVPPLLAAAVANDVAFMLAEQAVESRA